jgi:hypothetical protein
MEIRLSKRVAEEIGLRLFKPFLDNEESWSWKKEAFVNLAALTPKQLDAFEKIFQEHPTVHGIKVILKDIAVWRQALVGEGSPTVRAVRNLKPLLVRALGKVPGHRLYKKYDGDGDIWLAYYVDEIEYHPEERGRDHVRPAWTSMDLIHEQFGGKKETRVHFESEDCIGYTVLETLARKNFYMETPELRAKYLVEAKRFGETVPEIGKQFYAVGTATDDLDGNPNRSDSWYWHRTNTVTMERNGSPSRVVIDVFVEDEKERDSDREAYLHSYFWVSHTNKLFIQASAEEEDMEAAEIAADNDIEEPEIEVPIHPFVAVFDLKRHLRLQIHLNYLTPYVYDKTLSEKLILPIEQKDLVKMLISHSDQTFKDIIAGKGGGAVVLLTGLPGVGKTLTAEVYAESEERALYSVQCSQLGTDPNDLEDELLKVFTRAKRWKAVMLLDEADVYVHERGSDLSQNAIVGVFLRVLEYQSNILFLTTNRPDDVDDAIASRCVARLPYKVPNVEDQKRIWKVLAESSGIKIAPKMVDVIVEENPNLTGRDVKNLLKLAAMVEATKHEPITNKTIEFVKRFKPTGEQKV